MVSLRPEVASVRTILEVGCGAYPLITEGDRPKEPQERYVGVDIDPLRLAAAGTRAASFGVAANATFRHEDGRRLQEPDASIDEVFMCDVLGDPRLEGMDMFRMHPPDFRKRPVYARWNDEQEIPHLELIPALLREARRVLKPTGLLTIVEDQTPPTMYALEQVLQWIGFSIVEQLTQYDVGWQTAVRPYNRDARSSWPHTPSFIVQAVKNSLE